VVAGGSRAVDAYLDFEAGTRRLVQNDLSARPDSIVAKVSREIVGVLKDSVGRGPTRAKTYLHDDCLMTLLREGHTKTERTMSAGGGERAVAQGRVDLSEVIRDPLVEVVERNTGRKVVGFLSSSQQHPDLISFIFVFETSLLLSPVEDCEDRDRA
jgi:uncharacterized protein YbcI